MTFKKCMKALSPRWHQWENRLKKQKFGSSSSVDDSSKSDENCKSDLEDSDNSLSPSKPKQHKSNFKSVVNDDDDDDDKFMLDNVDDGKDDDDIWSKFNGKNND